MGHHFQQSIQSEWLKNRRSAASWLVITGGLLIPSILLFARIYRFDLLAEENLSPHVWKTIYNRSWQHMGILLLPMGVILITSLVAQTEFRNNTWKQVHALPQSLTTIFLAKFTVISVYLLAGFLLFTIGIYLIGAIPALLPGISYPTAPFPLFSILKGTGKFMVACLPMVALQFLLSLQFRNFLVPIGAGFGLYVASMIAMNWKHGYIMPYIYSAYISLGKTNIGTTGTSLLVLPCIYFGAIMSLGYYMYINKNDKA